MKLYYATEAIFFDTIRKIDPYFESTDECAHETDAREVRVPTLK